MGEKDIRYGPEMDTKRAQGFIEEYKKYADQLISRKDELTAGMDPALFSEHLALLEKASIAATNASSLFSAHLRNYSNDGAVRSQEALFHRVGAEYSEKMLYFSQELKSWGAEKLLWYAEKIPTYQFYLKKKARAIKYLLSADEERIINYKDLSGSDKILEVYLMMTSRYEYELTLDGEKKTLTGPEVRAIMRGTDRKKREIASKAYIEPYYTDDEIIMEMYRAIVTDWDVETVKLRGYDDPIHSRHEINEIDAQTYEALCATIPRMNALFDRYFELKRQVLGYEKMYSWDLYAPIPGLPENISYEEAQKRVFAAYGAFAPWMEKLGRSIVDNNRVDVYPRKHKEGGACCFYFDLGELPAMSLNHTDDYNSLTTLAHELGHCVHALLEREDGRTLGTGVPLLLAEMGSNWAEILVFDAVKEEGTKEQRIAILCDKIDDTYASSVVQLRYVEFEKHAHKLIEEGAGKEELHALWTKLQKEGLRSIEWGDKWARWMCIPHIFHTPFYCYAYSFGIMLTLAMHHKYTQQGKSFIPSIRAILASGGRYPAAELFAQYDMDITTIDFWNEAIDTVEGWVNELELLIK